MIEPIISEEEYIRGLTRDSSAQAATVRELVDKNIRLRKVNRELRKQVRDLINKIASTGVKSKECDA